MRTTAQMVLLSVAKLTAGALYPSIVCTILSKCYATRYFLHHSWLALMVDLEPTHKLHTCESSAPVVGQAICGSPAYRRRGNWAAGR